MSKIVYPHEICDECGKCHCMDCALKEIEPDPEEIKEFLRYLCS